MDEQDTIANSGSA